MSIYGMIKFQDLSAVKLGMANQAFVFVLYATVSTQGKLHEKSTKCLELWKNQMLLFGKLSYKSNFVGRKLKSMRPLKTYVGPFYYVEKETWLCVVDTVLNTTVTFLLM